jgi:CheY-like chemotaxis protein
MAREHILMIEDDEEMIALGELILEKEGFDVLSATSGPIGLEILRNAPVDLVLLDIMMEGMDGWETLERIKSDKKMEQIPIIMLTARPYLEDKQQADLYADQFESYVVKPFVVRELVDKVKKVLSILK